MNLLSSSLLAIASVGLLTSPLEAEQKEVTAKSTLTISGKEESWRYLLHLPGNYDSAAPEKGWPVLFFLHGRSIRGRDLNMVKRYGPPQFLDKQPDFPFVVISPQLPDGGWPSSSLVELLDEVVGKYRVDPDRVCLTGTSLGGGGSWYFAAAAPEKFAAFAPVCGYGGIALAKKLTKLPIWAFHGDADKIVSIEPHQALIDAINDLGGNARLTVIPGGTHGSVIFPSYENDELYGWMLQQRRSP